MTTKAFKNHMLSGGIGSPTLECSCGRTVFSDSDCYDPGELERLIKLKAAKPTHYVYLEGDDAVVGHNVLGKFYVEGCECEGLLDQLEALIWSHRREIAKYLRERCTDVIDYNVGVVADLGSVKP